jgi:hypothetical protein
MRELIEFKITDKNDAPHIYEINELPAHKAFKLGLYFAGIFAGANGKSEQEIAKNILASLDDDKLFSNVKTVLTTDVLRDGKPIDIDKDYTGNLIEMVTAIAKILMINYGDFFSGKFQETIREVVS